MDCWEHETAGQGPVPAVAFCRHCGAALCREHATVCTGERVRQNGRSSPWEWCNGPSCGGQAVRAVRGSGFTSLPVSSAAVSRQRVRTSRPR